MNNLTTRFLQVGVCSAAGLLLAAGTGLAQESAPTEPLPLTDELIVLEYSTVGEDISFEMLTDDRAVLAVNAPGSVSGDLEGTMSSNPNQLVELPDPPTDSFAVTFTIETADGTIEGYYAGTIHGAAGGAAATINAHGQILAVTGVYADLFLADVFVTGEVPLDPQGVGTGENGTMTLAPRRT